MPVSNTRTLEQIIRNMEEHIAPLPLPDFGKTVYKIDGLTDQGKRNAISYWIRDLKKCIK